MFGILIGMEGGGGTSLSKLEAEIREFLAREERGGIDLKRCRGIIDALDGDFAAEAREAQKHGDHRIGGNISAASWISQICGMSVPAAKDRLCVGEQLESLLLVAEALAKGEISYQAASVICHQRENLGEKSDCLDEEQWLSFAPQHQIKDPNWIADHFRYAVDPEGFEHETEENYEARFLHISEINGNYH